MSGEGERRGTRGLQVARGEGSSSSSRSGSMRNSHPAGNKQVGFEARHTALHCHALHCRQAGGEINSWREAWR